MENKATLFQKVLNNCTKIFNNCRKYQEHKKKMSLTKANTNKTSNHTLTDKVGLFWKSFEPQHK
ncbi:MAG: hypothetical protein ACFFG0_53540 [Candidatus Thorarchaeota archaeon]